MGSSEADTAASFQHSGLVFSYFWLHLPQHTTVTGLLSWVEHYHVILMGPVGLISSAECLRPCLHILKDPASISIQLELR